MTTVKQFLNRITLELQSMPDSLESLEIDQFGVVTAFTDRKGERVQRMITDTRQTVVFDALGTKEQTASDIAFLKDLAFSLFDFEQDAEQSDLFNKVNSLLIELEGETNCFEIPILKIS